MLHILNPKGHIKTQEKGYPLTTPVYLALGSENEINSQDIENNLVKLYQNILTNSKSINPIKEYAKAINMKIYSCEWRWKNLIKTLISNWYSYKKYKEKRLTSFITNTPILQHLTITETRKRLKELHPEELKIIFNSTEKEFLIGKKSTFTLKDIIKELDEENKK